ncbi:MAG: Eco29kI family restriction endonuclease [Rhodospirillales bacterium]
MNETAPYNPLDKRHLGESVAEAMLRNRPVQLEKLVRFSGAGIYAIYYVGDFPLYQPITDRNTHDRFEAPVYVGKAIPAGARKGGFGLGTNPGTALFNRLNEHAKSIAETNNLDISDFYCRFLVVDDIWIPLGESLLIAKFSPLWNLWIDGFGNHDPGKGRYDQEQSRWDILHPGRAFAAKCAARQESLGQIQTDVAARLRDQYS